jgi:membrane protease subunit HflK
LRLRELKRVPVGRGLLERALGRPSTPRLEERLTGDRNLILASAIVQYEIRDARDYLFNVTDVPGLVSNVTSAALSSVISGMKVDDILTVDRLAIQEKVRRDAQAALTRYGAGVRLTAVQFEELAAPREVAGAFRDVTRAREDRQRVVNEADGYAKRILPQTSGEATKLLLEAEAQGEETVQKALGDATRFSMLLEEMRGDRSLVFKRLILETLERVLPRLRKIVLDRGAADAVDLSILEEKE